MSISLMANAVFYKVAKVPQQGLDLEVIWPVDEEVCEDFGAAVDVMKTLCDQHGGSVLMLIQTSSSGPSRAQKTIRVQNC